MNVVCVKVKPEYTSDYVNRLYHAVERNLTVPHKFICLTDNPEGVECDMVALNKPFPTWWAKMYVFKETANDVTLYFDLDTIIAGSIDFFAEYQGEFASLMNWWGSGYASCVFMVRPKIAAQVWAHFTKNPQYWIKSYRSDQEYMSTAHTGADSLQQLFPGKFASYKDKIWPRDELDGQSVICFHGLPRPHHVAHLNFMQEHWV